MNLSSSLSTRLKASAPTTEFAFYQSHLFEKKKNLGSINIIINTNFTFYRRIKIVSYKLAL